MKLREKLRAFLNRNKGAATSDKFFEKPVAKLVLTEEELLKYNEVIDKAVAEIKSADAILINAGAGMGVDTGMPTYRGKYGIYNKKITVDKLMFEIEDFAVPEIFVEHPEIAWAFHANRIKDFLKAIPHEGFDVLKRIVNAKNDNYFVFTSNIDNHFQRAGFDENRIMECHGSSFWLQSIDNDPESLWEIDDVDVKLSATEYKAIAPLPSCPKTGKLARPNTLFFGDESWNPTRYLDQDLRMKEWLEVNANNKAKLLIVEIGAGTKIPTVRSKSERTLENYPGPVTLIRINPEDYQVPHGQISILIGSLATLLEFEKRLK